MSNTSEMYLIILTVLIEVSFLFPLYFSDYFNKHLF